MFFISHVSSVENQNMRETQPNMLGLFLGLLLHVSSGWLALIFVINILLFIYKGIELPYAGPYLPMDIILYVCWGFMSLIRTQVGNRGVRRLDGVALIMFSVVTLFAMIASLYFALFQTYVLRLEFIFNIFSLALEIIEFLLGITSAIMYIVSQKV